MYTICTTLPLSFFKYRMSFLDTLSPLWSHHFLLLLSALLRNTSVIQIALNFTKQGGQVFCKTVIKSWLHEIDFSPILLWLKFEVSTCAHAHTLTHTHTHTHTQRHTYTFYSSVNLLSGLGKKLNQSHSRCSRNKLASTFYTTT